MKESAKKTFLCVLIGIVIVLVLVVIPRMKEKEEQQLLITDTSVTSEDVASAETSGESELVLLSITPSDDATEASVSEPDPEPESELEPEPEPEPEQETVDYHFRSKKLLNSHYEKHGIEMGFESAADYEAAASAVVNNPDSLHKTEKEDGDDVYYLEETNEFVIVSQDGYIRTYFNPSDGIRYYNRQ